MKKAVLISLIISVLLAASGIALAGQNDLLPVNKSTVYKVDKESLWTTTLNNLQVITQHRVTSTSQIYLNDRPALLEQLKPGYAVVVTYLNDSYKTAVLIKAYSTIVIQ